MPERENIGIVVVTPIVITDEDAAGKLLETKQVPDSRFLVSHPLRDCFATSGTCENAADGCGEYGDQRMPQAVTPARIGEGS